MSGEKIVLHLKEASRREGVSLSPDQARWLHETGVANVAPGQSGGTYDLMVKNVVGILTKNDLVVAISPKIPVADLVWLITYGRTRTEIRPTKADLKTTDFVTAIAQVFASYVGQATGRGLLRGYWDAADVGPTLRGRVRMADQMNRHYGRLFPLELEYQDFGVDIRENRVLATALRTLIGALDSRESVEPAAAEVRQDLLSLLRPFHGIETLAARDSGVTARTRLNVRYWDALSLAELILARAGLDAAPGYAGGRSFLVEMWRIFEEATVRAVREHLPYYDVVSQVSVGYMEGAPALQLRPDIMIRSGEQIVAIIDTKYKSPEPKANDVYQLFMYAKVFDLRQVHLIYASPEAAPEGESFLTIRGTGVGIGIHVLGVGDPRTTWRSQVSELLERVVPREE